MELFLCGAAFLSFYAGFPASALLIRCGLSACQRFSPRAALALSLLASLFACACALLARGGLRAVPAYGRVPLCVSAFMGGTMGRALLLMVNARLFSSFSLLRLQAFPLLALSILSLLPNRQKRTHAKLGPRAQLILCFFCAMADGFLGAGGMVLLTRILPSPIARRTNAPTLQQLLPLFCAQCGALLLTMFSSAAQPFPPRMLVGLCLGAVLGALAAHMQKKRGPAMRPLRAALQAYLIFAALTGIEQSFFPSLMAE